MCFSVAFTKNIVERDPRFTWLLEKEVDTGTRINGFAFPMLPVLAREGFMLMRWGIIPHWVKDAQKARDIRTKTLNARSETVGEKPSFRSSWPLMRCALPVNGFYEPHLEDGKKSTWYIRAKDREFMFLGCIYARPPNLPDYSFHTFSILTLTATDLLAWVHNEKLRMPLMLAPGKEQEWLECGDPLEGKWLCDQDGLTAQVKF